MSDVFIAGGLRTFISLKDKAYKNIPAEDLAAAVLKELNERNLKKGIKADSVILGNCTGGGGNPARLALLKAGLDDSIAGFTVDAQCASGMESLISAYARIKADLENVILAGGAESSSTACIRSYNPNHPNFDFDKTDNSYKSAQFIPEDFSENSMIKGADETCRKYGFTPEELAACAEESHKRAVKASEEGIFSDITLSLNNLTKDEGIRSSMTHAFANRLRPVLTDGIITPATSCLFSDGAAFLTLCSKSESEKSAGPLYKILSTASTGAHRNLSPESLIVVLDKLIEKSGLREQDIDFIDYNEAFACVDLLYKKRFQTASNVFGGALAYGHPYGASGALITLHLMKALEHFDKKLGIAAIPAAGGIASAILIERVR